MRLDSKGHTIIAIAALFFGAACSYDNSTDVEYRRGPTKGDDGAALVAAKCGKCHDGVTHPLKFDTPEKFKTAKVVKRISEGSMPPGGGLDAETKEKLLAYAKGSS